MFYGIKEAIEHYRIRYRRYRDYKRLFDLQNEQLYDDIGVTRDEIERLCRQTRLI